MKYFTEEQIVRNALAADREARNDAIIAAQVAYEKAATAAVTAAILDGDLSVTGMTVAAESGHTDISRAPVTNCERVFVKNCEHTIKMAKLAFEDGSEETLYNFTCHPNGWFTAIRYPEMEEISMCFLGWNYDFD